MPKKLKVKSAKDLISKPLPPEKPMKLEPVVVPPLPPLKVEVSTLQKVWAVLQGWLNTKVKDAADGKRVDLPSFAWLQYWHVIAAVVIVVGLYLILR